MADAEPRVVYAMNVGNNAYYNEITDVSVYAFSLEIIDGVTYAPIKGADFSSIYTESLVEVGAIVYPSFMGYIISADADEDYSDVILSIVDHSDDDTVYSAYFDPTILTTGSTITFTEGDTPPEPSDGGGDGGGD